MARRKEIKNLFGTLYEYEYDGDKLVSFKKADDKTGKNGISTGKSNAPKKEAPKSAVKKVDDKLSSVSKSLGERVYGETTKDVTLGKDFRQDIKRLDEQKTIEKAEKSISGYAKAKAWAFKMEYERTDGYSRLSSTIGDDIQKLMSDYNNAKNNKVDQVAYDELRERSKKIRDDLRNYHDYYSLYNTEDAQNATTFGELEQLASGIHDDLHYSDDVNGFYNRKQSQGVQSYAELRQKRGLLQRRRGSDGYDNDRVNAELEALDKYGYNQNVIDSMTDEDWEYEKQRLKAARDNAALENQKYSSYDYINKQYDDAVNVRGLTEEEAKNELHAKQSKLNDEFNYYNNLLSEVEELERTTKIEREIAKKWGDYKSKIPDGGVHAKIEAPGNGWEYNAVNYGFVPEGQIVTDATGGGWVANKSEIHNAKLYNFAIADEINMYNYLHDNVSPEKATEYLKDITPILNKRMSQYESAEAYKKAQESPIFATIGSTAYNGLFGGVEALINDAINGVMTISGKEIDPYSPRFQTYRDMQATQQGVKDTIDSKVGKIIYGAGTQIAELTISMLAAQGIGSAVGGLAKGANAAQIANKASNIANQVLLSSKSMLDTTLRYKESGESDLAAVGMGMLSGLIEAYTERKSLSNLLKSPDIFKDMATKVKVGKWASKIGVDALKEGLEEIEANALNTIAALVFDYRDNDSFLSAIDKAKAGGKSDSEALAEAIKAVAPEYVESFVVGALAGGAFGAVNTASSINTVNNVIDISSDYFGKNGTSRQSVERLLIDMGYSDEAEIAKAANAIVRKGNGRSVDKNTEALFEDDVRLRGMLYGYVEAVDAGARRDTVSEVLDEARETETPEPTATSVPKNTTVTKPEAELTEEEAEERKQRYALINDDNAEESYRTRGRSGSKVYTYAVNKGGLIDELIKDGYSAEEATKTIDKLFGFMYNQGRTNGNVDIAVKAASENIVSGYEAQAREFFVAGQMDAQGRLIGKTNARLVPNQTLKNMQSNGQINSLTARAINTLASKLGINIAFSDTMKGGALGSFNKKTGTLLISSKAKNKYFLTAVHESIHTIRTIHPESYNKMNEVVYDILKDNKAVHSKAWNKILSSYRKEATKDGKIDRDLINEELTAKVVSHLLADEAYIKELAQTDRTTLQRIYDAIVDFFDKIFKRYSEDASPRETEFKDALKELQGEFNTIKAMYENALKETTNVQKSKMVLPKETKINTNHEVKIDSVDKTNGVVEKNKPTITSGDETEEIFIDDRSFEDVSSRKVKAFQYKHPEVKPFYKTIAEELIEDVKNTTKGERIQIGNGLNNQWTGTNRLTSESVARIRDDIGATYNEIENALQRIIDDEGQENVALAKKIELVIDDMLSDGYVNFYGESVPPDEKYLVVKEKIDGLEYSKSDSNWIDDELFLKGEMEAEKKIFSTTDEVENKFSQKVDAWYNGELKGDDHFELGDTPFVLKVLGAKDLPMVYNMGVMYKMTGGKHSIYKDVIKELPQAINNPIMIFKSSSVNNAYVLVTELSDKVGDAVVVAVHLNKYQKRMKINRIASAYGKENIERFIEAETKIGQLKYIDTKKYQQWSTNRGLQLPKLVQSIADNNNILQKEDIVNTYFMKYGKKYSDDSVLNSKESTDETSAENIDPGVQGTQASFESSYFELKKEVQKKLEEHNKKYGTMKKGMMPARDIDIPNKVSNDRHVRRYARSEIESEVVTNKMAESLTEALVNGDPRLTYNPISNKKLMSRAEVDLQTKGYEQMKKEWFSHYESNQKITAQFIANAELLLVESQRNGDVETYAKLLLTLPEIGTEAGQVVQALSIIKRLPGAETLAMIDSIIGKVQTIKNRVEKGKAKAIEVPDELKQKYVEAKDKEVKENENKINKAKEKVVDAVADQVDGFGNEQLGKFVEDAWKFAFQIISGNGDVTAEDVDIQKEVVDKHRNQKAKAEAEFANSVAELNGILDEILDEETLKKQEVKVLKDLQRRVDNAKTRLQKLEGDLSNFENDMMIAESAYDEAMKNYRNALETKRNVTLLKERAERAKIRADKARAKAIEAQSYIDGYLLEIEEARSEYLEAVKDIERSKYLKNLRDNMVKRAESAIRKAEKMAQKVAAAQEDYDNAKITYQNAIDHYLARKATRDAWVEKRKKGEHAGEVALAAMDRAIGRIQDQVNSRYGFNEDGTPKKKLKLDLKLIEDYGNAVLDNALGKNDISESEKILKEIVQMIADQVPATMWKKALAFQYLAMLSGSKTHIKNMASNVVMGVAVTAKNFFAVAAESTVGRLLSKFKSQTEFNNRTKSLKGLVKRGKEYAFAKKDVDIVRNIIQNGSEYDESADKGVPNLSVKDVMRARKIFQKRRWSKIYDNRFGRAIADGMKEADSKRIRKLGTSFGNLLDKGLMNTLSDFNSGLLDAEDWLFGKRHYARALTSYLVTNKIDVDNITETQLNQARTYAIKEAQKATFKDNVAAVNALNAASKTSAVFAFAVQTTMPFKKTPANIFRRGVEYSPVGFVKTITKGLYEVKKGYKSSAEWCDDLAASTTGTGILVIGFLGFLKGFLVGPGDDDEENEMLRELYGYQNYALKIGDATYTLDWASPVVMPLFVGYNLAKFIEDKDIDNADFLEFAAGMIQALPSMFGPFVDNTMLSGFANLFSSAMYSSDPVDAMVSAIASLPGDYLSMFIPAPLKALARTVDGTKRKYYVDKNSKIPDEVQMFLQQLMQSLPGYTKKLPPAIDRKGEEIKQNGDNIWQRFIQNFISPGYYKKIKSTIVDDEIMRLYKLSGEKGIIPKKVEKKIVVGGETVHLTLEQYTKYQQVTGQAYYSKLKEIIPSDYYQNLSDTDKVRLLEKAREYAVEKGKEETLSDYHSSEGWLMKAFETDGLYRHVLNEVKEGKFSEDDLVGDAREFYEEEKDKIFSDILAEYNPDKLDYELADKFYEDLYDLSEKIALEANSDGQYVIEDTWINNAKELEAEERAQYIYGRAILTQYDDQDKANDALQNDSFISDKVRGYLLEKSSFSSDNPSKLYSNHVARHSNEISFEEYTKLWEKWEAAEKYKVGNKTVDKKDQILPEINKLKISNAAKSRIYDSFDWGNSEKALKNVPWSYVPDSQSPDVLSKRVGQDISAKSSYASKNSPYNKNNNDADFGQCVWYARGRAKELLGKNIPAMGNANQMFANAKKNSKVEAKPENLRANMLVTYNKGTSTAGQHAGHVIYIEAVDGDTVYYTEGGNYNMSGKLRTATREDIMTGITDDRKLGSDIIGFIDVTKY